MLVCDWSYALRPFASRLSSGTLTVFALAAIALGACDDGPTDNVQAGTEERSLQPTPSSPGIHDIGEPCNSASECGVGPAPVCIEPDFEWLNGYCSSACTTHADCGDNGGCVAFTDGTAACLEFCNLDDDCRDGYGCLHLEGNPSFCVPETIIDG